MDRTLKIVPTLHSIDGCDPFKALTDPLASQPHSDFQQAIKQTHSGFVSAHLFSREQQASASQLAVVIGQTHAEHSMQLCQQEFKSPFNLTSFF